MFLGWRTLLKSISKGIFENIHILTFEELF